MYASVGHSISSSSKPKAPVTAGDARGPSASAPKAAQQKLESGMTVVDGFEKKAPSRGIVLGSSMKWAPAGQTDRSEASKATAVKIAQPQIPANGVGSNKPAGVPVDAAITSSAEGRNPGKYDAALDQFNVEKNPRYTPRDGKTYCNIYVNDATRAMGAEIPTTYNDITGEPGKGSYEHNANGMVDWLNKHGEKKGWKQVSAEEAQKHANSGKPAVAAWKNPGAGSGHVAMVRPGEVTSKGPAIAQAGGTNMQNGTVADGFKGVGYKSEIQYWVHD